MPVGVKVTLRGNGTGFSSQVDSNCFTQHSRFSGVPTKLDGQGNYTLGITDHSIFPEIKVERQ